MTRTACTVVALSLISVQPALAMSGDLIGPGVCSSVAPTLLSATYSAAEDSEIVARGDVVYVASSTDLRAIDATLTLPLCTHVDSVTIDGEDGPMGTHEILGTTIVGGLQEVVVRLNLLSGDGLGPTRPTVFTIANDLDGQVVQHAVSLVEASDIGDEPVGLDYHNDELHNRMITNAHGMFGDDWTSSEGLVLGQYSDLELSTHGDIHVEYLLSGPDTICDDMLDGYILLDWQPDLVAGLVEDWGWWGGYSVLDQCEPELGFGLVDAWLRGDGGESLTEDLLARVGAAIGSVDCALCGVYIEDVSPEVGDPEYGHIGVDVNLPFRTVQINVPYTAYRDLGDPDGRGLALPDERVAVVASGFVDVAQVGSPEPFVTSETTLRTTPRGHFAWPDAPIAEGTSAGDAARAELRGFTRAVPVPFAELPVGRLVGKRGDLNALVGGELGAAVFDLASPCAVQLDRTWPTAARTLVMAPNDADLVGGGSPGPWFPADDGYTVTLAFADTTAEAGVLASVPDCPEVGGNPPLLAQ